MFVVMSDPATGQVATVGSTRPAASTSFTP